jgi:beta-galactosidase
MHAEFPNLPLLSTESSATLSTRGEYHFPVEEIYRGYIHETKQITSYDLVNTGFGALPDVEFELQEAPWLAGQFVWSGFDYHGEPDPYEEGYFPAHSSYFGIVDMCGLKKDRFYLYQSQWTDEPMIHLLPHWNWEGREGEVTPVYVYSNCPEVDLVADRSSINADGEDLSFVTVKITDQEGNICPEAGNMIHFAIEGAATLACVGNGDPTCIESYQKHQRSAFHGLCLLVVKSTTDAGSIKVTARSEGLENAVIELSTESL